MELIPIKKQLYFDRNECADDSNFHNPVHYHDLFEIYYIIEGSCLYFIDHHSYRLQAGDLVLIPEGVIHNTVYQNTGHSRLLINCAPRFIPAAARPKGYLYRNLEIADEVRRLMEAVEAEYNAADRFSEDAVSCYLRLLFFLLARHPNHFDSAEERSSAVTRAAEWLQQHFTEDVTLPELAAQVAVSPEHLCRLFKKETGFGFREYLGLLRLQKAEQLLKESRAATVAEVASLCGFADSNYFSVKFKELYGVSPKAFQRSRE